MLDIPYGEALSMLGGALYRFATSTSVDNVGYDQLKQCNLDDHDIDQHTLHGSQHHHDADQVPVQRGRPHVWFRVSLL